MKVLLVDDSRIIRSIERNLLAELDHSDVIEATDGSEGLQQIQIHQPDLVLIDWSLPDMDGVALIRSIREKDETLPLVICVTEEEKHHLIEAVQAGVDDYLVKPFDVETLAEKIEVTMAKVQVAVSAV